MPASPTQPSDSQPTCLPSTGTLQRPSSLAALTVLFPLPIRKKKKRKLPLLFPPFAFRTHTRTPNSHTTRVEPEQKRKKRELDTVELVVVVVSSVVYLQTTKPRTLPKYRRTVAVARSSLPVMDAARLGTRPDDVHQNHPPPQSAEEDEDPDQDTDTEAVRIVPRKCLMCLQPYDELGSVATESPEELKRIVDNIYKIAKIQVTPSGGKIEPLCSSCRAKLGFDFDEDAYYEMLRRMYSETTTTTASPNSPGTTTTTHNPATTMAPTIPVHIGLLPLENPDSPTGSLLDTACGTFVVTELAPEDPSDKSDLKCVICSKVFNFKSTLRLHIRSHHNTTIREPEPHKPVRKPRMYECVDCNLSFKLKYDYDKHQAIHNRANLFQCEVCFKLFKHKSYYLMHRNAKRCKAVPLNLSTRADREIGSLNDGIRNTS